MTRTGSFPAKYPGRCPVCADRYRQGDLISYHRGDGPMHQECADLVVAEEQTTYAPRKTGR